MQFSLCHLLRLHVRCTSDEVRCWFHNRLQVNRILNSCYAGATGHGIQCLDHMSHSRLKASLVEYLTEKRLMRL
jgi:hypothetical protein